MFLPSGGGSAQRVQAPDHGTHPCKFAHDLIGPSVTLVRRRDPVQEGHVTQTLAPLTIGELLDRTFVYYRRHLMMFVGIAALPNLFVLAFQLSGVMLRPRGGGVAVLISLLTVVIALVASTFSHGATVIAVSHIQLDRETNIAEAFRTIQSQLGELIVITLNVGVRVALGTLLLIVPGILQALKYALAVPVAILEQNGVSASLSRSADLTSGHRGRIFVIYFLFTILVFIGSMVWQVPAGFVAGFGRATPRLPLPWTAQVIVLFGGFVTQAFLSPIMTIGLTLVYYDERVRKEAFDLEHMMHQLDRTAVVASPSA
jgi:hypothetical protein